MKHKHEDKLPQDKDRHLDVPQEANRDKHINFLDIEDPVNDNRKKNSDTEERQKQWKEGIEEGKKERRERT